MPAHCWVRPVRLQPEVSLADIGAKVATFRKPAPIGPPHLQILNVDFLKPATPLSTGANQADDWE